MLGPATRIQACLRSTVNPDLVEVYDLQRGFDCLGERDGADVIVDNAFSYQCKLRRGLPSYLQDWLRGIVAAGERSGTTGVVVWKTPRTLDDDAVVVLRLKDWQSTTRARTKKSPRW